jgi:methionyl-tRNA formyltransferase
MRLKLVVMATPAFVLPVLDTLRAAGHRILCVYTPSPRPAGRGRQPHRSAVHDYALKAGIPVRTPENFANPAAVAEFAALKPDCALVIAYGLILPPAILAVPRLGCLNLHFSLLPRWRGAAPVERAILAGDTETGVTVMKMDEGLDTGPIVLARKCPIWPGATATGVKAELALLGAEALIAALAGLAHGTIVPTAQPATGVTYAARIDPDEARIDWSRPAVEIERKVRALNPSPGVWFMAKGERIKLIEALAEENGSSGARKARPGDVLGDALIACGQGALKLVRLQRQGRRALPAVEFLRGFALPSTLRTHDRG